MRTIERLLNLVPMYRITLYYVGALWLIAIGLAALGALPFNPLAVALSGVFLLGVCGLVSDLYATVFRVPENHESAYITALILTLIISPASSLPGLWFLAAAGILAISSKYILAVRGKHIFNPAAAAVVITALAFGQNATWWVGTLPMLPFVLAGGLLLARKIHRFDAVLSFFAVATVASVGYYVVLQGVEPSAVLDQLLVNSPLFFLGFVMLTEPRTMPGTRSTRIIYGALVGALFSPFVQFGSFVYSPELALVTGNLFSYFVSAKDKLVLTLTKKREVSPGTWDFSFITDRPFAYEPGQYLEWTLGNVRFDGKGNRRYFTIASSPSEREVHLGVRLQEPLSAFKRALLSMRPGETILASQRAGDFTLPRDRRRPLAFVAGGIGVTPFRSMVRHMLDHNDARRVSLFYAARSPEDVAYRDVFDAARARLGMQTVYAVDSAPGPLSAPFYRGRISAELLARAMPDWQKRTYYLSGPERMVAAFKRDLRALGVPRRRIKTDYFPGFM